MTDPTVVRLAGDDENTRSDSEILWKIIKKSSENLAFEPYLAYMDTVMGKTADARDAGDTPRGRKDAGDTPPDRRQFVLQRLDAYELLRVATEYWLLHQAGVLDVDNFVRADAQQKTLPRFPLASKDGDAVLIDMRQAYYQDLKDTSPNNVLPYLSSIFRSLDKVALKDKDTVTLSYGIVPSRLTGPVGLELIWSYWIEEAGLVQTMNVISHRFQNRRTPYARDALANLATDPLRSLSSILWGYVKDEMNRLSVLHRAHEYVSQYGLPIRGLAVPELNPVDVRARFIAAYHDLLGRAVKYYRDVDDKTISADPFELLTALRDVQLVLAEGMHNQYGDLTWTARLEMLMMQWILAQPEVKEFLQWRPMMPYPEKWMGPVDAMNRMQNWNESSVLNFRELATCGERLLLSIRFGHWNANAQPQDAANWAFFFRGDIARYIYAYRAVTGADLAAEPVIVTNQTTPHLDDPRYRLPADLLRRNPQRPIMGPTARGALGGVGYADPTSVAGRLGTGRPDGR